MNYLCMVWAFNMQPTALTPFIPNNSSLELKIDGEYVAIKRIGFQGEPSGWWRVVDAIEKNH